jgi:hypothetical protein
VDVAWVAARKGRWHGACGSSSQTRTQSGRRPAGVCRSHVLTKP